MKKYYVDIIYGVKAKCGVKYLNPPRDEEQEEVHENINVIQRNANTFVKKTNTNTPVKDVLPSVKNTNAKPRKPVNKQLI